MPDKPRIFLDSGALLAGLWPDDAPARTILRLGEMGAFQLLASKEVLREVETVLRERSLLALPNLAFALDQCGLQVAAPPDAVLIRACLKLVPQRDASIVAAAWAAQASFFVTLEYATLVQNIALRGLAPFVPGRPAECLNWWRQRLTHRLVAGN